MSSTLRFDWSVTKPIGNGYDDLYLVIAEEEDGKWSFFERETWDIRWSLIPETPELLKKALEEKAKYENALRPEDLVDCAESNENFLGLVCLSTAQTTQVDDGVTGAFNQATSNLEACVAELLASENRWFAR